MFEELAEDPSSYIHDTICIYTIGSDQLPYFLIIWSPLSDFRTSRSGSG